MYEKRGSEIFAGDSGIKEKSSRRAPSLDPNWNSPRLRKYL